MVATTFLKKWSGLARPANTARLYLPKQEGGLALPSISLLYKRLKVSQGALLLTSCDRITEQRAFRTLQEEETQVRPKFKPVTFCREIKSDDPGARRQTLAKRAKNAVTLEDATVRREHAESLIVQGQMMRTSTYASAIWATAVLSEALKFALNAATDTLPHSSNLAKWRRGVVSEQCKLCGRKQTLPTTVRLHFSYVVITRGTTKSWLSFQNWLNLTFLMIITSQQISGRTTMIFLHTLFRLISAQICCCGQILTRHCTS